MAFRDIGSHQAARCPRRGKWRSEYLTACRVKKSRCSAKFRRAAPSLGKIVGKGKYASVLWVLNPDRDTYYENPGGKDESLCC